VAPTILEALRIAGDKNILPDDVTKAEIARAQGPGKVKVVGSYKLCINTEGTVTEVKTMRPSRFPAYDEKLVRGMYDWRYTPFLINGQPVPVCTAVTFIYSQINPEPDPPTAKP